ncbi:hypothetical protein SBRY_50301 [Actinacidiphila bryophytorum]|uniref:Uncharacterized protein n=1 Tax=Actinacidiphila bryophytorum TaxID=1436133 RepID=A0A9W4H4G4_9ACTN|nr:hypothetical protein SBRY_50301 [Actinacidiphila bryophytorum]
MRCGRWSRCGNTTSAPSGPGCARWRTTGRGSPSWPASRPHACGGCIWQALHSRSPNGAWASTRSSPCAQPRTAVPACPPHRRVGTGSVRDRGGWRFPVGGLRHRAGVVRARRLRGHGRRLRRRSGQGHPPGGRHRLGSGLHRGRRRLLRGVGRIRRPRTEIPDHRGDRGVGPPPGRAHRPPGPRTRRGRPLRPPARQGPGQPQRLRPARRVPDARRPGLADLAARPGRAVRGRCARSRNGGGRRALGGRHGVRSRRRPPTRPLHRRPCAPRPPHGPRPVVLDPAPELLRRLPRVVGPVPDGLRQLAVRRRRRARPAPHVVPADPRERQAPAGQAHGRTPRLHRVRRPHQRLRPPASPLVPAPASRPPPARQLPDAALTRPNPERPVSTGRG